MRPHVEHVGAFLLGLAERHSNGDEDERRLMVEHMLDFERVGITPEQAIELDLPGLDVDALAAYDASGDDDWTRDLSLLTEKVEVEALAPQQLRAAVLPAIEEALDLDLLKQAHQDEQSQRQRVRTMRDRLAVEWGTNS